MDSFTLDMPMHWYSWVIVLGILLWVVKTLAHDWLGR